jgi:hypothetical protein
MAVPTYVTVSVIGVSFFAVVAVAVVLRRLAMARGSSPAIGVRVGLGLGLWMVTTAILAAGGVYQETAYLVIPGVAIALIIGVVALGLAVAASPPLRAILADPSSQGELLWLQVWRLEGLAFLVLMGLGQLPALFSVPAGIGDLAIGLTVPWMATNFHRRKLALAWNAFGLLDLTVAIFLGAAATPGAVQLFHPNPTTEIMTMFPMALIPTYLVPLSLGLHFVAGRNLLRSGDRSVQGTQSSE